MPRMRSESCTFIWQPNVVTWYRLPLLMRPRLAPGRTNLLPDYERSFHAGFGMPGDSAEEGVGTGSEIGADRGLAFGERFRDGQFLAVLLDRDVVFQRCRI